MVTRVTMRISALVALGSLLCVPVGADWPEFRGPSGDGHALSPDNPPGVPTEWSEDRNVKWKTAIPHRGWSTPVVLGGQVWITTATEEGHDAYAIGLDAETGKILFNELVFHTEHPEPLGNGASMNCYATPSAFIEPGRVFVHFGSAGTACLDTSNGKILWKRSDLPCRHYRGPSSSPVSFEDLIILTLDGADLQYHVALDKQTGRTVWKTDRSVAWNDENVPGQMARDGDLRKAHSTPLIVHTAGKPQLISAGAKAAYGYDPRTGRELWRVQYPDWSVAPRPVFANGIAYLVTGLSKKEMWAVKTDGTGDVTDTAVVWKLRTHVGRYSSPLLVDGLIYMPAEESFISCFDAATGDVVWTERIGGKFAASPVYADGRLYFFSQEGNTTVVKPGRKFELLATNTLDDGFMASPAVSGSAFFLRTRSHLYRIEAER
jgi:outer membrane protein assembly factor BamB